MSDRYVVDHVKKIDLAPVGTDGYFQPVSILSREIVDKDCRAALVRGDRVEPLTLGEDPSFTTLVDMGSTFAKMKSASRIDTP